MDKSLISYLEEAILSQYDYFDKAHGRKHIESVIADSLEIAKDYDINEKMVYTIAAYHDIGIQFGRENHEKTSGKYLMPTEQPRKFQPSHSFENNFPQKERNQTAVAKSS